MTDYSHIKYLITCERVERGRRGVLANTVWHVRTTGGTALASFWKSRDAELFCAALDA